LPIGNGIGFCGVFINMKPLLTALIAATLVAAVETASTFPDPVKDSHPTGKVPAETAVLAGGCFWGVEAVFEQLNGVSDVVSGYAGGSQMTAHYSIVSSGVTSHAESVKITFDPTKVSYGRLLKVFFAVAHDPTELNRQGPDEGRQYRSSIFYGNDEQKSIAEAYIAQLQTAHVFNRPIVTTVVALEGFYPAEEYHQNFLAQHPDYPYIVVNDLPKLRALKAEFPELVKQKK
jgi:peptide-methionine (S)-S-oxide reductase